ncbi:hypothetical protein QE389_002643 [Brevundimonas sp. SORGH_AS 993]|nr:hypothetical protein [Brevundimonas sp. SORGH_AS_0993]
MNRLVRHRAVGVDHRDGAAGLIRADGRIRHQQGVVGAGAGDLGAAEHAGAQEAVGVGQDGAQADHARGGVHGVVREVETAGVLVGAFVLQAHIDRRALVGAAFTQILQQDRFRTVEDEVDRAARDDGGQDVAGRRSAGDDIARIDATIGHAARGRRRDAGVVQVQTRGADRGVGGGQIGLGRIDGGLVGVILGLGHRLRRQQGLAAGQVGAGQGQLRLHLGDLGLGLGQGGLGRARVQGEQQLALLNHLTVAEVNRLDIAPDAGAHIHALDRLEPAGELVPVAHLLLQRRGHCHRRRALRRSFRLWRTTIKGARHHDGHSRDLQPAHRRNLPVGGKSQSCGQRPMGGANHVNAW